MSWAKFDDRYDDNRKVKRAWRDNPAAVGLHAMAITYCCRHRTDGLVDLDWIEEKLPNARQRAAILRTLEERGLFSRVDDEHYIVNDYLVYNPSREDKENQSRGAKAAALARWGKRDASEDAMRDACETHSDPHAEPNATPLPNPTPTQVEPDRPDVDRLLKTLAELMLGNDPKAKVAPESKRWRTDMRLLIDADKRPVDEIEQVIRWCQADQFWRSNILSPGKLREKYTALLLRMHNDRSQNGQASGPKRSLAERLGAA